MFTHQHDLLKQEAASTPIPLEVLAFTLGMEEYGVDIQTVQELRGYDPVTQMVNAPPFMKGVINLRGVIVAILDLRIKFALGVPTYDAFTVVIILNIGDRMTGIVVDRVSDVITLRPEQIRQAPELGAAVDSDYLIGLATVEERMLILVNLERLVSGIAAGVREEAAAQTQGNSMRIG